MGSNSSVYIIIPVIFLYLALRTWTGGARQRRIRIETMWIIPVMYLGLVATTLGADPPALDPVTIGVLGVALILGLVGGWYRGRMTQITIHPDTHEMMGQTSPWGYALLAAVYLIRYAARTLLMGQAAGWRISPASISDAFLLLAVGMIVGRRIEILIRGMRLLSKARADKAAGQTVPDIVTEEHS